MKQYIPIIGLEIHVELKTASKMFCGCRNNPFHAPKPNIYTCPVCLGLPGALPVPNKKAIEQTVMLGLALGCRINKESRFDRKHYFYPDLPKGYQISQYEKPFCVEGKLLTGLPRPRWSSGPRNDGVIRIRRVHLEEDTGKLLHRKINGEDVSLIDFNRSGVPLAEIVTEPDIRSSEEAKEVAQKIQRMVRFLGISNADMEKGSMRLEANISLTNRQIDKSINRLIDKLPDYKVELKNINSFRFLERAINQEIDRQKKILSLNKVVKQQTFGWDTEKQELKPQRVKEEAADYRYFPEPDIPPIRLTDRRISELKYQISDLPDEVFEKLIQAGVSRQAAKVISGNKAVANVMVRGIRSIRKTRGVREGEVRDFANWVVHRQNLAKETSAEELVIMFRREKTEVVGDEKQLASWVDETIRENKKAVGDYQKGKEAALMFLIGKIQRSAGGKADVKKVKEILIKKLK